MNKQEARNLLKKYLEGGCTPEEKGLLESWYLRYERKNLPELSLREKQQSLENIRRSLPGGQVQHKPLYRRSLFWPGAAAAVVVALGLSWYIFVTAYDSVPVSPEAEYADQMLPGGNKALLTLADGRKISLTDAADGKVADQAGTTLTKTETGQLVYQANPGSASPSSRPEDIAWNTVETPKGGQYQLVLPDGSKVWLNAASSLKYPASFAGLNERRVILKGEAYFEVTGDHSKPFRVSGEKQEIEVLGTRFNIYSYADEGVVKTTLLEGSLQVRAEGTAHGSRVLKPGEQSSLSAGGLEVQRVDAEGAIAWKNGLFMFHDDSLDHIMRLIARWYDVEVEFSDSEMRDDRFNGTVSRFANASQVLEKLELTGGVQFTVQRRKITVSKPAAH